MEVNRFYADFARISGGNIMNKTELIAAIAERTELTKKDADNALKAFIDVVGDELSKGEKVQLDGKALASMNMWGFTPDYFEKSEAIFKDFIVRNANELKAEFYIPYAIDCMIKDNSARTELLSTPSRWFGVTFKEDRPGVVAKFQEFADKGIYPSPLY